MAIFGGSLYAALLWRAGFRRLPSGRTRALFAIAATLAIFSEIVWFCLIAGEMSGSSQGSFDPATLEVAATATRFGHIFVGRFIGLVALWLMCVLGMRSKHLGVPILAGLLLASLGPISHAAATGTDIASVGAISDAAHLLTAGFWLGGLLVLAMLLQRHWRDRDSVVGALRLFSTWGTAAVAVLVISGLINAILIVPPTMMSLRNSYFGLLLVKVGLAFAMIGLAALNRWRLAPAFRRGGEGAMQHLTASVGSEIALGFTIIAIAGLLGFISPH
jgi:putative copper resistance protein D